jgi:hypothetical protein
MDVSMTLAAPAANAVNGFYVEDLDLSACDPAKADSPSSTGNNSSNSNSVFGNIVVKTLPNLAANYITAQWYHSSKGVRTAINNASGISLAPQNPVTADEAVDTYRDVMNDADTFTGQIKEYLNQWAQVEFCKIKYADRTGNINLPFSNNWVPGSVGALYTRNPGVFLNFFVTDVTHTFSIAAPNQGSAVTSVNFNGGRMGGSINQGLAQLELYQYGFDNSQAFCQAFLTDISHP